MKLYIKVLILVFLLIALMGYYFNDCKLRKEKEDVNYSFYLKSYANELIIKSLVMEKSVKKYLITADENDLILYNNCQVSPRCTIPKAIF